MTKIIIVGPAYPLRGGISDFNEALAKSFHEKNIKIEIVSFSLQYPKIFFPGKSQNRVSNSQRYPYKISPLINSINPFSWLRAAKYILSENPDKVIIRFWMPFFAPCLGIISNIIKKNNIKVIGIVDNAIAHEKRFGDSSLVNFFLKKCHHHITLSKKVQNDIKTINSNISVKVLFHPIYNNYKPLTEKKSALNRLHLNDGKYILFFGLVRKYKGLDLAIRAMADEEIISQNIKLIVAGEFYESEDVYNKLINQLNLKNIIIFNEFVVDDKVPDFFSICNLVILPYKSATQSGVTQLAMNYSKPMLVTNVGGLPEIIDHDKDGYISSIEPKEISKHILNYFSDENNEIKMSAALSKKQHFYSWDHFTDEILK